VEAASALLKAGARIELKSKVDKTTLDYARKYDKKELLAFLSK